MNGKIYPSLYQYVEYHILPRYHSFDSAHQADHVYKVIEESLLLATHYTVDINMVYAIAAYHDLGLCEGREFHHLTSSRIMQADNQLRQWFTEEQIKTMAEAVEDHRASNQYTPRSIYGKIVAEADRSINPTTTLLRTIQYGMSHYPELKKEEQYLRFCNHLQEKYAEGGYLKLWIPESDNAVQLNNLRNIIADKTKLKIIFNQLFDAELSKRKNNQ